MSYSTKTEWYHHPWYKRTEHEKKAFAIWGNWKEFPFSVVDLPIESCVPFLNEENIITAKFEDVAWKGKHLYPAQSFDRCPCCFGKRTDPDISYPPIISNISNPYNDKYRCIDRKHRIAKMISMGMTESRFYYIEFQKLKPYFILS